MEPDLRQRITLFFRHPLEAPNIRPGHPETLGVLFLLRRDIQGCLSESKYLIPATMTILAGIDLLGKFYAGSDKINEAGPRFRKFVTAYFGPFSAGDEKHIYALRNALFHSFSLYSDGRAFMLAERHPSGAFIVVEPDNTLIISITTLYSRFEQAIEHYYVALSTDETLQQNFAQMFDRYGLTHMGIGNASPSDLPHS